MDSKIIVFLDNIQRTIVATVVLQSNDTLTITKPAILNVSPTNEKKLQVQLYPLMFREFLKDRDVFPTWTYSKSAIVISSDCELEPNLIAQYTEMFKAANASPAPTIKLFDADDAK
jgi:hypothetical protein